MTQRTAILGLGLIGGSIGMALRAAGWTVVGWGPREASLRSALALGAIDLFAGTVREAIENAGLVIVASPIRAMPDLFRAIAHAARPGTVVTDVASVKAQVMAWAAELLPPSIHFVGGHPMAGREVQGVAAADAGLLRGCTYCLVGGDEAGLAEAQQLVGAVGARSLVISAEDHDRAVAAASHLPFVTAAALVQCLGTELADLAGSVASSGFRDSTRIALGSAAMHADICNFNSRAIGEMIDRLIHELELFRQELDSPGIERRFEEAAQARQLWGKSRAGRRAEDTKQAGLFIVPGREG